MKLHSTDRLSIGMTDEQRAIHRPGRGVVPRFPFGRTMQEAYHIEEVKNPMGHYWKWTIRRSEDRDL